MDFAQWPYFEEDEIQAVVGVLKSGKVNQWTGNEISSFEKEFSQYVGTEYSIALANGSLALDMALMAFGIGKGDEVIVTPRSFVASVSCVALNGAIPVFVDIDPISQNITLENISRAVSSKTKAVILVHLSGWSSELDQIQLFCKKEKIALIEDCAQAHGAGYRDKKVGSFGDCSIFSFCQDKIMTTGGEGGMLLTNKRRIWEKVWSYKDHGRKYSQVFFRKHEPGFRWFIENFGTNCRMTEMQAAIGRVMLKKLDKWVKLRRYYANLLTDGFKKIPGLRVAVPDSDIYHSYYKYYVFLNPDELKNGWNRGAILSALNEKNIPCNTGICPEIYLEKAFENYHFKIVSAKEIYDGDFKRNDKIPRLPHAKKLGETSMVFLVHPTLDVKAIHYVVDQVKIIMEKVSK